VSNTFIVLVFSELPSFVRKILQGEENKRVELAEGWRGKLEGSGKWDREERKVGDKEGWGELQRTEQWAAARMN